MIARGQAWGMQTGSRGADKRNVVAPGLVGLKVCY